MNGSASAETPAGSRIFSSAPSSSGFLGGDQSARKASLRTSPIVAGIPRRFSERVGDCPVDKLDIRKAEMGRALAHRGGKRQRRPENFGQQRPADATPRPEGP